MNSADSGSEGSSDASDQNDNQVCFSALVTIQSYFTPVFKSLDNPLKLDFGTCGSKITNSYINVPQSRKSKYDMSYSY